MTATEHQLTRSDFDRCSWEKLIAEAADKECFAYSRLFSKRLKESNAAGDAVAAEVFGVLAMVTDVELRENDAEPFAPRFLGKVARGTSPDDLNAEQYRVLKELAPSIPDAEMRARVCDPLWVMQREYQLAKVAVDAYVDSARIWEHPEQWVNCAQRITRAIRLAKSLGGGGLEEFERAIAYSEDLVIRLNGEDPSFLSARLMELLQEFKQGVPAQYAALAEKLATRAERDGGSAFERAGLYWHLAANWHEIGGDTSKQEAAKIAAAETFVKWAEESARKPSENLPYLNAASQLETAFHALQKINTPAARSLAESVYRRLVEIQQKSISELRSYNHSVDLTDSTKIAEDSVSGKTLIEALMNLACLALPRPIVKLREQAEKHFGHPLQGFISAVKIGSTGKVIATRPHFESTAEGREQAIVAEMHKNAVNHYRLTVAGAILPAIMKISAERRVREGDFLRIASTSFFVPTGREMTMAKGLYAGFTGDLIVAAHLLIPQIEHSIRLSLEACGAITSGFDHLSRQNEYDLNKTLFMDKLNLVYDADTIFALRTLLVEHHGSNFRNFMAHGLLNDGELYSDITVLCGR